MDSNSKTHQVKQMRVAKAMRKTNANEFLGPNGLKYVFAVIVIYDYMDMFCM